MNDFMDWLGNFLSGLFDFFMSRTFLVIMGCAVGLFFCYLLYRSLLLVRAKRLETLTYTRFFSVRGLHAGDSAVLTEVIYNRSFLPMLFVNIGSYYPGGLVPEGADPQKNDSVRYFRSRFNLPPRSRITRTRNVLCVRRGVYGIDTAEILTGGEFIYLSAPARIYVYPAVCDEYPRLTFSSGTTGECDCLNRFVPDPFILSGIRPYQSGDPFSSINFKASARTVSNGGCRLMVNSNDSSSQFNLMIYYNLNLPREAGLDTRDATELSELGLSYCAAMLESAVFSGGRVGFAANGADRGGGKYMRCLPDGSLAHAEEILRGMADIEMIGGASFPALLDIDLNDSSALYDSDICILTFYMDDEISRRIELLRHRGRSVNVLLLSPHTEEARL